MPRNASFADLPRETYHLSLGADELRNSLNSSPNARKG